MKIEFTLTAGVESADWERWTGQPMASGTTVAGEVRDYLLHNLLIDDAVAAGGPLKDPRLELTGPRARAEAPMFGWRPGWVACEGIADDEGLQALFWAEAISPISWNGFAIPKFRREIVEAILVCLASDYEIRWDDAGKIAAVAFREDPSIIEIIVPSPDGLYTVGGGWTWHEIDHRDDVPNMGYRHA